MLLYNNNASSVRIEFSILRVVIHIFNFQKQNYFRDITARDKLNRRTDTRSVKYDNIIILYYKLLCNNNNNKHKPRSFSNDELEKKNLY